jgi:hypothetical protein
VIELSSANRNLFCTSDRLVKSGPLATCDHGGEHVADDVQVMTPEESAKAAEKARKMMAKRDRTSPRPR